MEQPSDTSDGLQPQELSSACNLPRVFDLSKNSEECLLKTNSIEALHVVQPPGWYLTSGTSNGSVLPEDETDPSLQPSEQIQPDNALSNTTVTLSYVTRSHVFSAHDSLSQHSQIYSVPISKAFSLHPTTYDASQLVTDAGGTPLCVEMDQHCLQQVSVPVGLAACASPFDFVTPAQVVENVASLCYLQQAHNISGIQDVESLALETLRSLQQNNPAECKIPLNLDEIQNGAVGSLWNTGSLDGSFPAGHVENIVDQHKNGNPEVLFLISRTDEPVILPNDQEPAGLAVSLNQEFISALDDSVSPPFASLIGVKDVSILPQTAGSQIEENSLAEETNTRQDELSNVESDLLTSVEERDSSSATDALSTTISSELTENAVDTSRSEQSEESRALSEVQKEETHVHNVTHKKTPLPRSLFAKKETLVRKELPPRSRRGMRLEAIVQNIFPSRYKSSHVSSAKKSRRSDAQPDETTHLGSSQDVSFGNNDNNVLEEECPPKVGTETNEKTAQLQEESEETDVADSSKISTSCSETVSKHSLANPSPGMSHKPIAYVKKSKKRQNFSNHSPVRVGKRTALPTSKRTKSPLKQRTLTKSNKSSARAKKVHTPKKKRKTHKVGQSSMFSPQEPEIKLKYVSYKEEKREKRDETFSPFVHVELKAYPTCTVINYPDESPRLSRGKQPTPVVSGKIPTTPCLQYGRVSMEGTRWDALVCCLCGGSANAMDLGDLHGPYYPEGFRPEARLPTNPQEPREDDSSESDSSSSQTRKPHHKLQAAALGAYQTWSSDGELSCSPAAKRSRMDTMTDWYTPPIVPLEASEYWLHEDCGIWSAGVFLVRGKLYGLERAVKMAKETICSSCHKFGATLGCFFKGCPNKYHYICAMQSDCVLYEENFSMKCRKHKNKSIKGVSSNKQNSR
ncbi:transcription factor 20 isoform X1 [Pangasianodon hypophthalmus]|uniref:transcription factor 20 isoform X1 n=1 Tax=Pangasianodon hypophthalmus TaxID=310915 RepID=UPI0023076134|nr:transcription factor 20 isoform X1 [Pangasianodon hypophthalmus]